MDEGIEAERERRTSVNEKVVSKRGSLETVDVFIVAVCGHEKRLLYVFSVTPFFSVLTSSTHT